MQGLHTEEPTLLRHTIQQGDHLPALAQRYAFQNYETIWNHPDNAELKQLRKNPNVLLPGDEVTIPDRQMGSAGVATGKVHRFKVRPSSLALRLVILTWSRRPRANEACALAVEGDSRDLTTDGDGKVERTIAATDRRAAVALDDVEVPIDIGYLDPIDEPSGWQGRLINLGYLESLIDDEEEQDLRSAIEEFQCDQGMTVTGRCDTATRQKILEVHGV